MNNKTLLYLITGLQLLTIFVFSSLHIYDITEDDIPIEKIDSLISINRDSNKLQYQNTIIKKINDSTFIWLPIKDNQ